MATDNKYDRQLRLWGANGQKALSESCIVLINATACGTETLKNLVLPGIGQFHIIDDAMVSGTAGNGNGGGSGKSTVKPFSNFFVFPGEKDLSRAEVATTHLSELNPDVKGSFTAVDSLESVDYKSILSTIASKTVGKVLVICADLPHVILKKISLLCWDGLDAGGASSGSGSSSIPLIIVKSYGLIGQVRVQTPYHAIIESKPDNAKPDLRLAEVASSDYFTELKDLAASIDLASLDSQQHGHVPYVIILIKALEQWREKNNDNGGNNTRLPKTFDEKNSFRQVIKSMARNWNNEVNFMEADDNAYLAFSSNEIPWEVQGFIDSAEETIQNKINNGSAVKPFDALLLALNRFIAKHSAPPLNGSIPDMTSSTQSYIQLQGVYKKRAECDKSEMRGILDEISEQYSEGGIPTISEDELASFCKNIFNLRLIKTRSYVDEYNFEYSSEDEKGEILGDLAAVAYDPYEVPEHTPLLWYIALRACDMFYDEHGQYPGTDDRELALESDASTLQTYIETILKKFNLNESEFFQSTLLSTEDDKKLAFAKEMTRYQNAQVHNLASVIGGVASQEAVKLVTAQYVPMEGNYIFNGIASVAGVYKI